MSSTDTEAVPARPARWRALIALFGVAMFVLGVGIGGLGLPHLLALNPAVTPQASVVAQVPLATATTTSAATSVALATPATATLAPPTATAPPPTATVAPTATTPPPTATTAPPTATAIATLAPTPTVAPTNPASAIFAPDPAATGTTTAAPTAAAGTATSGPTTTATATGTTTATATVSATGTPASTPTSTPTVTPTSAAFAATDQIFTELPVNFRAGPGTTFAAQTTLPPGTLLAATGETATVDGVTWRQFRLANGLVGWVRAQDVTTVR